MALRDLTQFLEDDGLEYPLQASSFDDPARFPDGKTYKVASPSAKVGLWLTGLTDVALRAAAGADLAADDLAKLQLDDDGEKNFHRTVLGAAVYDEMIADGVKWTVLQRIGRDAYLCFAMSQQSADAVLAGAGEAVARGNRATRRAAKKPVGSRSPRASTAATGSVPAPTSRTSGSSTSPNAPVAAQTAAEAV